MDDLSEFRATGTNNPDKQVSVTKWNNLLDDLEAPFVTPEQFGAVGDGVTDDSAAFVAAIAYLNTNAVSGRGYTKGSNRLVCFAKHYYLGSTTLDIAHSLTIEGQTGVDATGAATVLRWAANTTGIRLQRHNTEDAAAMGGTGFGADGMILRGLWLEGAYSGIEGEYHGIHAKARFRAENVFIYDFQGDGVFIQAVAGSGLGETEGNANGWHLDKVTVLGCRNGFYINGPDANAGNAIGCNAMACRQAGFFDSSFLGNTYVGCHADGNGIISGSLSLCSYNGNRYYVRLGQEAGASANAPSGTTADNTWWGYHAAGGPTTGATAWTSGLTWRTGGAYITDSASGSSVLVGCYSEGGQPISQITSPTLVVGGLQGAGVRGALVAVGTAATTNLGVTTGSENAYVNILNRGTFSELTLKGNSTSYGAFGIANGSYTYITASPKLRILVGATYGAAADVGEFLTTGLNLASGKVLQVAGTRVVGARGAAVADATDAASAITQLNALLARCRAHGLIAP